MKRVFFYVLIILVTGASCVPIQKERPGVAGIPGGGALLPDHQREMLKRRIQGLRSLMEQGILDQEQSALAASVIRMYENIIGGQRPLRPLERELLRILTEMEGNYFEMARGKALEAKELIVKFLNARDEVLQLYLSGNYAGVINKCVSLRDRYGPNALGPQLETLLSFSLAKEGLLEEAIEIGERVLENIEDLPGTTLLMASIASWYLDLGKREKALESLERLTKVLNEFNFHAKRLGGRLAALGSGREPSAGPPQEPDSKPREPSVEPATTLEAAIQKAYELAEKKDFDNAREYLLQLRARLEHPSQRDTIDQALKVIDQREEEYLESKIAALSRDRFTLENAKRLAEEERYEEAISTLDQLLAVSPENKEAQILRDSLVEKHINRERNRAARLFLAAKNVSDPAKKKRYLRSCLEILKGIVDKYPSSHLIPKVNSHIQKVSKELERLE